MSLFSGVPGQENSLRGTLTVIGQRRQGALPGRGSIHPPMTSSTATRQQINRAGASYLPAAYRVSTVCFPSASLSLYSGFATAFARFHPRLPARPRTCRPGRRTKRPGRRRGLVRFLSLMNRAAGLGPKGRSSRDSGLNGTCRAQSRLFTVAACASLF